MSTLIIDRPVCIQTPAGVIAYVLSKQIEDNEVDPNGLFISLPS